MDNLDRGAATDSEVRVRLERWLAGDPDTGMGNGEMVTSAVLLFCTEQIQADGSVARRRGRAYPLGDLSPADEFWLVERAARDVRDNDD